MPHSEFARRRAYEQGRRDGARLKGLLYLETALYNACPYVWFSELAHEWRRGVEEQRNDGSKVR